MISDFHLHSFFSSDSTERPENTVKSAISLEMKEICFTDHMDYGYPISKDEPDLTFKLDIPSYTAYLEAIKERYKKEININIGIELGIMPGISKENNKIISSYDFDFVIASTHLIRGLDPYFSTFWEGKSIEEMINIYFGDTLEAIKEFDNYDSLGHLDYLTRYIPDKQYIFAYEAHKKIIDEILKWLIKKDKALEVNTAGFKYNMGRTNPGSTILARFYELGGRLITVGSDAHKSSYTGYAFSSINPLLKRCGFDSYYTFTQRNPVKHLI